MRVLLLFLIAFTITGSKAQQEFQLASPILIYPSTFAAGPTVITILFHEPNTEVRYTVNGKEPTRKDKKYTQPISITGTRVILKAKAFGSAYNASETVSAEFVRGGKNIANISFTPPHESYSKVPSNILHDNLGGIVQYGSGTWLGYNSDTVEVNINLTKKEKVSSVLMDLLEDENSWIFLPEQYELYYFNDTTARFQLAALRSVKPTDSMAKRCQLHEIKLAKPLLTDKLRLVFQTVKSIPGWHPGKGQHGWFFIDEIKVY